MSASNFSCFTDPKGNKFYFSYNNLIAFRLIKDGELRIIKNYWGCTTGKHLNSINRDKNIRLTQEEFDNEYNSIFIN